MRQLVYNEEMAYNQAPAGNMGIAWVGPSLMLYGTEEGWDVLKARRTSLDTHNALANGLADTVRKIHAFWLDERRCRMETGEAPGVLRREPVRSAPKVGRNEPCPCGSGKKYKQCHGNPARLH